VTFELSGVWSDRRFWEMVTSLKNYYQERNVVLPLCYNHIPDSYNCEQDYRTLRQEFAEVKFFKHPYIGQISDVAGAVNTAPYRQLAQIVSEKTDQILERLIKL
jgi:hypothetical protein